MQSCDIAHQIIEAVARNLTRRVKVDAAELLHDLSVIRDLKVGHERLAEALDLDVLAVVLADRYARVDDVRNDHHDLGDLFVQLGLFLFELRQLLAVGRDLRLQLLRLFALAARVTAAYFLGNLIAVGAQGIRLALCGSRLLVQLDHFVYERQLLILKFVLDVLFYHVGVFS